MVQELALQVRVLSSQERWLKSLLNLGSVKGVSPVLERVKVWEGVLSTKTLPKSKEVSEGVRRVGVRGPPGGKTWVDVGSSEDEGGGGSSEDEVDVGSSEDEVDVGSSEDEGGGGSSKDEGGGGSSKDGGREGSSKDEGGGGSSKDGGREGSSKDEGGGGSSKDGGREGSSLTTLGGRVTSK